MKNYNEIINQLTNIFERDSIFEVRPVRDIVLDIFNIMGINHFDRALQLDVAGFLDKEGFDFIETTNLLECLRYLLDMDLDEHAIRNIMHLCMNKDDKTAIDSWVMTALKIYYWLRFGTCKQINKDQYLYTKNTRFSLWG